MIILPPLATAFFILDFTRCDIIFRSLYNRLTSLIIRSISSVRQSIAKESPMYGRSGKARYFRCYSFVSKMCLCYVYIVLYIYLSYVFHVFFLIPLLLCIQFHNSIYILCKGLVILICPYSNYLMGFIRKFKVDPLCRFSFIPRNIFLCASNRL